VRPVLPLSATAPPPLRLEEAAEVGVDEAVPGRLACDTRLRLADRPADG
jgi:hypothetical protein